MSDKPAAQSNASREELLSIPTLDMEPKVSVSPKSSRPRGLITENTGEEVRPYKRMRLMDALDEFITLIVGKDRISETMIVHKNILCNASPFFETACKPEWMKEDQVLKLPQDEPQYVRAMIHWMYHNEICLSLSKQRTIGWEILVNIYVLGQKYQMPNLRNDILDAMNSYDIDGDHCYLIRAGQCLTPKALTDAFSHTLTGSPLRVFLLQLVKECFTTSSLQRIQAQITSFEFWSDFGLKMLEDFDTRTDRPFNLDDNMVAFDGPKHICSSFHTHAAGFPECTKTKEMNRIAEDEE